MKENNLSIKVTINYDLAEEILRKTLQRDYELLSSRMSLPLFSSDPEEEEYKIRKLKKAYKLILKYYNIGSKGMFISEGR